MFLFATSSLWAVEFSKPPIQREWGSRGVKLIICLHRAPSLRINAALLSISCTPWRGSLAAQGQIRLLLRRCSGEHVGTPLSTRNFLAEIVYQCLIAHWLVDQSFGQLANIILCSNFVILITTNVHSTALKDDVGRVEDQLRRLCNTHREIRNTYILQDGSP